MVRVSPFRDHLPKMETIKLYLEISIEDIDPVYAREQITARIRSRLETVSWVEEVKMRHIQTKLI